MNILTFTTLWPNAEQPNFGVFVKHRIAAMAKLGDVDVRVVAPVPYFPSAAWNTPLAFHRRGAEYAEATQRDVLTLRASSAKLCASAVEKFLKVLIPESTMSRWQLLARIPEKEVIDGLETFHLRYLVTPKICMRFYGGWMAFGAWPTIERLHAEKPFDLIDAHYVYPDGYAAVRLGKKLNIPVVITARGTDVNLFSQMPAIRPKIINALNRADGVIAVSDSLKQRMIELGIIGQKIAVIGNGVDREIFYPRVRSEARRRLGLNAEDRIFITVGALVPVKGIDRLIDAMSLLPGRERIKLFVIGEGVERRRLESQISTLGLRDTVFPVGAKPQTELADWYSAADLFCLASHREGCPNVILEAMACGLPVVAADVGGIREMVGRDCGRLIANPTADNLATEISTALDSDWDRQKISERGGSRSWADVAREIFSYYSKRGNTQNSY